MSTSRLLFHTVPALFVRTALVVLFVECSIAVTEARAQFGNPLPPIISITQPPDESIQHNQTPEIRLEYTSDPECAVLQEPDEPDPCLPDESTLVVWVNGLNKTSSFTKHGSWANSTSVVLPDESWSTIRGKICNDFGCDEDTIQVYVQTLPAPPLVSTAPHNGDILSPALCVGCFDLTYVYSTPAYFSIDAPRSATLFYSSYQAAPMGLVAVDVWDSPYNTSPPDQISIKLKRPNGTWVTFTNNLDEVFFSFTEGDTLRLMVQFDATGLSTGAYGYTAVIRSWWGTTSKETSVPVRVLVLNEEESSIAPGWTVAGVQTLIPQGDTLVVVLDGAGGIAAFGQIGTDRFGAPRGDFTEIRKTGSGTYVRLWEDSTKAFFSTQGDGAIRADSIRDRFGNVTAFDFATNGKLIEIEDPMGQTISFLYSSSWQGLWFIDSGRLTTITGDPTTRNILSIKDPDNDGQSFTYYTNHRMKTSTDRELATTDYTYDEWGRVSTIQLAQVTLFNDSTVRPLIRLESLERRALVDSGGTSLSDPAAGIVPDSVFGLAIGPRQDTTRVWYNGPGQAVKVIDPLGHVTTASYNNDGLTTGVTLPSGQTISFSWQGDKLTHENIQGLRYTYHTYESTYGLPKTTSVQGNLVATNYYDSLGALDSVKIAGVSGVIKYLTDNRGRDTMVVDLSGHATRYRFNSTTGNTEWILRPGGQTTRQVYDTYGRVKYVISATSDTTEFVYDQLNRVTASYDPLNANPTEFYYGPIYADSLTDPKNEVYRFVHNALGWETERYGPADSMKSDNFGHDIAGNVRRWTNRNGQVVDYTLDLLGRVTAITAGGQTIAYGYDPSGQNRYEWGSNTWSTDTIWYTQAGFVDSTTTIRGGNTYIVDYEYGHWSGRPTKVHDRSNNRTIEFVYNEQGQLDTLKVRGVPTYVDLRNSDRFTLTRDYPALFDQSFKYTTDHQMGEIKWGEMISRGLGFDSAGRVVTIQPQTDTVYKYAYDKLGQLTRSEVYDPLWLYSCSFDSDWGTVCNPSWLTLLSADTFTYDELGNRTDADAQIGPGSRLSSHGGVTYTYDDAGNVIERNISPPLQVQQDLYWGPLGQLDSVVTTTQFGTSRDSLRYDAFGRRIQQSDEATTVDYVWAMGHVLFDTKDDTLTEYAYWPGTDRLHSMYRDGSFYYYLSDHLGSVCGISDNQGTLLNSYEYDVWGRSLSSSGSLDNRFRFAGRDLDFTGFYYNRGRYYDPQTGRFLSEDPLGLAGGLNPYMYAANNPVTLRDPWGLQEDGSPTEPPATDSMTVGNCVADPNNKACQVGSVDVVVDDWWKEAYRGLRGGWGWGISWGGGGVGGGDISPADLPDPRKEEPSCGRAWTGVILNGLLDVGTLAGYGLVVRLGKEARLLRLVGGTRYLNGGSGQAFYAGASVVEALQVEQFQIWRNSTATVGAGRSLFASELGGGATYNASPLRLLGEVVTDALPIVSTVKSIIKLGPACGYW